MPLVRPHRFLAFASLLSAFFGTPLAAQADASSLIKNSSLEADANADGWPDHWPKLKDNAVWLNEDGNHFIRLTSPDPAATTLLYLEIPIPENTPALELTWRWRATQFQAGKEAWHDGRFMMEFLDVDRVKVGKAPSVPTVRRTIKDWASRKVSFLVPEGAKTLKFMPSLTQIVSGSLDIDDIVLRPTDPEPIHAAIRDREAIAKARYVPPETDNKAKWPTELRAQGNRLVNADGKEVWLQGLNAGGLETLPHDTQPIKSLIVGIEEWNSNVIRLPISDKFWFGEHFTQKDGGAAYREKIDQCVTLAANRGVYIIIDLHEFRAVKPRYAKFWADIAPRYKNHPAVIYELLNEPFGTTWEVWRNGGYVSEHKGPDESAFLTDEEKKKNQGFEAVGMQGLLDVIRATGAKNLVVVAGLHWSFDLTGVTEGYALEDKTGNGIMYSWHVYNWHRGWEKHVLAAAAKYPILVGELGADTKKMDFLPHDIQEDPYTWVPDMLGFIQKHRLNWTGWCFHPYATPVLISDWHYTPTPFWGEFAKAALAGKQFELKRTR